MAGESAKRAGETYNGLFADDSKLVRSMRHIEKKLQRWGKRITAIRKGKAE
jgi:hypothetical protein